MIFLIFICRKMFMSGLCLIFLKKSQGRNRFDKFDICEQRKTCGNSDSCEKMLVNRCRVPEPQKTLTFCVNRIYFVRSTQYSKSLCFNKAIQCSLIHIMRVISKSNICCTNEIRSYCLTSIQADPA